MFPGSIGGDGRQERVIGVIGQIGLQDDDGRSGVVFIQFDRIGPDGGGFHAPPALVRVRDGFDGFGHGVDPFGVCRGQAGGVDAGDGLHEVGLGVHPRRRAGENGRHADEEDQGDHDDGMQQLLREKLGPHRDLLSGFEFSRSDEEFNPSNDIKYSPLSLESLGFPPNT